MALKKPGELFEGKAPEEKPSINVVENVKEEFNKVSQIRKQLDNVSSSLTEVVDKNLSFLSNEYSDLLEKFNNKINILKEEVNSKVDNLEKSDQYLKTEIQVIEQRQQNINLNRIKKEVISEVQDILSGDVSNNIKRLDEKIDLIRGSYKEVLNEGLLNEPPNTNNADPLTPLDQKFVTLDKFQEHYRLFVNRIQKQLSTLGGGGAVNIRDLDDVDLSTAQVNNKFLKYDSASGKWVGSDTSGGGYTLPVGSGTTLGGVKVGTGLTITTTGILSTTGGGGSIAGINTTGTSYFNQVVSSGVVTATNFVGDGSGLTGITGSGSGVVVKHDGSTVGTAGTINFSTNLDVSAISAGIVTVTASGGGGGSLSNLVEDTTPQLGGNLDVNNKNIVLSDSSGTTNDRIVLGHGSDFHIFHNSLDSHIDNNTGDLYFRCNVNADVGGNIRLQPKAGENGIIITHDASVELYENNIKRIETTTDGARIHGGLQDKDGNLGTSGQVLSSTGTELDWITPSNTQLSTEEVQDIVGAMFSGNTETNITATYQDSDGTIDLVASAGGSGLDTRGTTSAATGSIAQTASANITIPTRGKSFSLLKVAISAPAWVILYVDSASRSSDSSRSEGTDPAPGSGVLTEVSTTTAGASTFLMSPAVLGWNNDGTPAAQVYAKVTNKRSSSGSNAITVTLTTVSLEA